MPRLLAAFQKLSLRVSTGCAEAESDLSSVPRGWRHDFLCLARYSQTGFKHYGLRWTGLRLLSSGSGATNAPDQTSDRPLSTQVRTMTHCSEEGRLLAYRPSFVAVRSRPQPCHSRRGFFLPWANVQEPLQNSRFKKFFTGECCLCRV